MVSQYFIPFIWLPMAGKSGARRIISSFPVSKAVKRNSEGHDPNSPLLFGKVEEDDVIKVRKMKACRDCQMSLFNL